MTKIYVEVLAKAQLERKIEKNSFYETKIITTMMTIEGEIIKDREQIDIYTRADEYYEYDILKAEPLASNEFETIGSDGEKSNYYSDHGYKIKKIIEVYEEEIKFAEE